MSMTCPPQDLCTCYPSGWYILPPDFHMVYFLTFLKSWLRLPPFWPSPLHPSPSLYWVLFFLDYYDLLTYDVSICFCLFPFHPKNISSLRARSLFTLFCSCPRPLVSELHRLLHRRCSNISFRTDEFCMGSTEHGTKPRLRCNKLLFRSYSKSWLKWLRSWHVAGNLRGSDTLKRQEVRGRREVLFHCFFSSWTGVGVDWAAGHWGGVAMVSLLLPFISFLRGDAVPPSPNTGASS